MEFPCGKEHYIITNTISWEKTYTVSNANHVKLVTGEVIPVGIKIFKMDLTPDNRRSLDQEIAGAETCNHENIVKIHCKFMENNRLWVITPPPRPSIRSVMHYSFSRGLPEYSVFLILRQTLEALHYMHDVQNKAHGNIGADYIFANREYSGVELMQNILKYHTEKNKYLSGLPKGTTPPEYSGKMNDGGGCTKSGDVWNFGLLALELFYGLDVLSWNHGRFEMLVFGIRYEMEKIKRNRKQKEFGESSGGFNIGRKLGLGEKKMPPPEEPLMKVVSVKIPEKLIEVVAACLSDDPAKRPTTKQLLGYGLFQENIPGGESSLAKIMKVCKKKEAKLI